MAHTLMFDFDTLQYANSLKAAGVPEKQAEVQTQMLAETLKEQGSAINNLIDNHLATKHDIELVRKDIKELWLRMTITLGSIMLGGIALLQYLK